MSEPQLQRKLAALVSGDVVGYSRLMTDDELSTIRALTACRDKVAKVVEANGGRLVDFVGDNMLAEFSSTLDAVRCADHIHRSQAEFNQHVPEHRHLNFRLGIHLGAVTSDGERLYGDGVNIAARLEPLAAPGGICVSEEVYRQIHGKLDMEFVELGHQELKNISHPVKAYQAVLRNASSPASAGTKTPLSRWALPLPEKPSLAVLPFVNLSMDQEQSYFSEGLTIDIITALIHIPSLFLISDATVFNLDTASMSIPEIGRRLGVGYVLEGGVRRFEDRLRITARLTETDKGHQVWAQRFDRELGDLFEIQDEITNEIVTALDIELVSGEGGRHVRSVVKNSQAIEYYYRGWSAMFSSSAGDVHRSQQMFEEVIRLEPDSSLGYVMAAWSYWWGISQSVSVNKDRDLDRARYLSEKAQAMNDETGIADLVMAHMYLFDKDHDKALTAAERAVLARPNCDASIVAKASILNYLGQPEEAIPFARMAMRLSPVYPSYYPTVLGYAYYHSGNFSEARKAADVGLKIDPANLEALVLATVVDVALGHTAQAQETAGALRDAFPDFSPASFAENHPYQNPAQLEQILSHLKEAGLTSP